MLEYHRTLLADERRTPAYREAIRRVVKPGDVVIDLGCGSGILSFFALQSGASKVYALEQTHMADVAQFLTRHLEVADRLTVLHQESTEVEPRELADVLVTETMGAFGFDEGILGYVIDARARLLRPGAMILPQRLGLTLVPVEDEAEWNKLIGWWGEPRFGLDFEPLRVFASNSMQFIHLFEHSWLDDPAALIDVDLLTVESTVATGQWEFKARRDAEVHGFGVWFKATLVDGIVIENREARAMHWSQGFLPLEHPLPVTKGSPIELELETDNGKAWRWRGRVAGVEFDQTTYFSRPPCSSRSEGPIGI